MDIAIGLLGRTPFARDSALLGAGSRLGLAGEVLVKRRKRTLLLATFVQQENPIALAVWVGVAPGHRRAVRYALDQARRRDRGPTREVGRPR